MFTIPEDGWTDFELEGCSFYGLSYLNDVPFEWLDEAIHGLELLQPFCVKGYLEPGRIICSVSYYNCYIIYEDEMPYGNGSDSHEVSHTSMLDFCKSLHHDIKENVDEWAGFLCDKAPVVEARKIELLKKLDHLKKLIDRREELFNEEECFF